MCTSIWATEDHSPNNELRHTPQWPTPHPIELRHTPNELLQTPAMSYGTPTLMSYATPQCATPHSKWATPRPNELRHTPMSYAVPPTNYVTSWWATPNLNNQLRHTTQWGGALLTCFSNTVVNYPNVRFLFINSVLSALISQSLIPFLMAYSSHDIYE